MGRDFEKYVEVCHCGHHRATHYQERRNCLGVLCDCPRFADRLHEDKPSRVPRRVVKRAVPEAPITTPDLWPDDYDTGDP